MATLRDLLGRVLGFATLIGILLGLAALFDGDIVGFVPLGIVAFLWWGYIKLDQTCGAQPTIPPEFKLRLRVVSRPEDIGGEQMMALGFETTGVLAPGAPALRPALQLKLADGTPNSLGQGRPVLTVIDDLQEEDSTEFQWTIKFPKPLQIGAGSADWVNFGAVPIDALIFPEGGQRKIKATLRVLDLASGTVVSSAACVFRVSVANGYLEVEKEEGEAQAASLQLAMCMAAADGVIDEEEVEVIKTWGEKSVKALDSDSQAERRGVLNAALSGATDSIRSKSDESLRSNAISVLNDLGEVRYKYDAYELCLHVLKADGQAHPDEMAGVTQMARELGLDEEKVRWMTDRHTSDVEFTVVGDAENDDDRFLGITPDMDPIEVKRHLNKLFKKHSARASHDDPKVAEKAREWLERIGKARVRHLG